MTKNLICVSCPIGCRLSVEIEDEKVLSVAGNTCLRGAEYANDECVDPKRIVTSIAKIEGSEMPLPVKTAVPIKKQYIMDCVREIRRIVVKPPVKIGDIIIHDVCGSGVEILATANREER